MRAVVCAYGEVGAECLAELIESGLDIGLVVTHRDSPGEKQWFQSVADLAEAAGLDHIVPEDVNARECVERIALVSPDFLFSIYFRQMLKPRLLGLPKQGALNLHGSLLPRYRGRAPVNWAILNGETETGVTLHYMDEKPDHGDVVAQRAVPILRDDTALSLTRKLAAAGRVVLREAVPQLERGCAPRIAQDHARSSYFGGRRPADGEIDWRCPAERIRDLVRAVTDPWPGAFSSHRGQPLLVWWCETGPNRRDLAPGEIRLDAGGGVRVGAGDGSLSLERVGRSGGPILSASEWAKKESIRTGEKFLVCPGGQPNRSDQQTAGPQRSGTQGNQ